MTSLPSSGIKVLFSSKIFCKINFIKFLFVFDKYYLIINSIYSKDSLRKLQINYIASYFLYLMLYIFTVKFNMTRHFKNFAIFFLLNGPKQSGHGHHLRCAHPSTAPSLIPLPPLPKSPSTHLLDPPRRPPASLHCITPSPRLLLHFSALPRCAQ